MSSDKLIIFVKNEEAGKVKTRLAASEGDNKALEIYQQLLKYTHAQAQHAEADKEVWYSRFKAEEDIWASGGFTKKIQTGNDLGERMSAAFRESFIQPEIQRVVLIGSDCAEITTSIIEKALEKLKNCDLVLGPAEDGGYYLIGMSQYLPNLFNNIEWSTPSVLKQTLDRAKKEKIQWSLLATLSDVDTMEDWNRLKRQLISK
ncbi:MAG: glycosyltransferase [Balneolaceae bacterium]|nr:glycosyltransferase [Balneolaceae bacterium]